MAQKWKFENSPIFTEWVGKVWHVFLMRKLTAVARFYAGDMGTMDKFWEQWSVYAIFVNQQEKDSQIRSQNYSETTCKITLLRLWQYIYIRMLDWFKIFWWIVLRDIFMIVYFFHYIIFRKDDCL